MSEMDRATAFRFLYNLMLQRRHIGDQITAHILQMKSAGIDDITLIRDVIAETLENEDNRRRREENERKKDAIFAEFFGGPAP